MTRGSSSQVSEIMKSILFFLFIFLLLGFTDFPMLTLSIARNRRKAPTYVIIIFLKAKSTPTRSRSLLGQIRRTWTKMSWRC